MVGQLEEHNDYNFKTHNRQITNQNTFFNERFGRSDFNAISHQSEVEDSVYYMLKYITKNDERVVYSRGLKSYIVADILEEDIVCPYGDDEHEYKYVLADNFTCIVEGEIMGTVSPEIIEQMPKSNWQIYFVFRGAKG